MLIHRLKKKFSELFLYNRKKRSFYSNLSLSPENMDIGLKLLALRYLCHQIEKVVKHDFSPNSDRGLSKYNKAKKIIDSMKDIETFNSSDVRWAASILNKFELWHSGKQSNFVNSFEKTLTSKSNPKDLMRIIFSRRSVRFWKKKDVAKDLIYKIIEMGTMAPSSCNRQPWKFVVVKNINSSREKQNPSNRTMIKYAPYIIYIAIDDRLHPEKFAQAIDAGLVAQNILLAIEYFGLGACGMYQSEGINQKKTRKILGLNDNYYIYLAIPFGYPDEIPEVPARVNVKDITEIISIDANSLAEHLK